MTNIEKLQNFLSTHIPLTSWNYDGYKNTDDMLQTDWNQTLITKINQTSATIFKDTMKGGANIILISDNMKDIFKTLEYLTLEVESNYRFGILSGRFQVYAIPDLTKMKLEIPDENNKLKEVDYDENKIYVCKLKDTANIFDVKKYIKIGVITIRKNTNLFE
ncbi:MAG: hypothetical protein WC516_09845 [Patescibacteria group bacterium]